MIGRKTGTSYKSGNHALTKEEVYKLLGSISNIHDKALIALCIATGIRREDIVQIKRSGYISKIGVIIYYENKKRIYNVIYIPSNTVINFLDEHINLSRDSEWLFPSPTKTGRYTNGHVSGRHLYDLFNEYLDIAELERRPLHCLRATCFQLAIQSNWGYPNSAALINDTLNIAEEHYNAPSTGDMQQEAKNKPLF